MGRFVKNIIDGQKIVELRKLRNWEQQDLAKVAGITSSVVSRLERNLQSDCKLSVIVAISKALDVPVESLFKIEIQTQHTKVVPALELAISKLGSCLKQVHFAFEQGDFSPLLHHL